MSNVDPAMIAASVPLIVGSARIVASVLREDPERADPRNRPGPRERLILVAIAVINWAAVLVCLALAGLTVHLVDRPAGYILAGALTACSVAGMVPAVDLTRYTLAHYRLLRSS